MTENTNKDYVLVDVFGGNGGCPQPMGPFTFDEADSLLRQGAAICGSYRATTGYWSSLPSWVVRDDLTWVMQKLDDDFSIVLNEAREENL